MVTSRFGFLKKDKGLMMDKVKNLWNKCISLFLVALLLISLFPAIDVKAEDFEPDFEAYYSDEVGDAVKKVVSESESGAYVLSGEKQDVYNKMYRKLDLTGWVVHITTSKGDCISCKNNL